MSDASPFGPLAGRALQIKKEKDTEKKNTRAAMARPRRFCSYRKLCFCLFLVCWVSSKACAIWRARAVSAAIESFMLFIYFFSLMGFLKSLRNPFESYIYIFFFSGFGSTTVFSEERARSWPSGRFFVC